MVAKKSATKKPSASAKSSPKRSQQQTKVPDTFRPNTVTVFVSVIAGTGLAILMLIAYTWI